MDTYISFLRGMWAQMADNFCVSAILASAVTAFIEYTGGDGRAFMLWLAFSMIDCVLGVFRAVLWRQFSQGKLYRWFFKIATQIVIIMLFAMMLDMVRITAGIELVLTNWLVLFFAFFDFSTSIDKLISLHVPIPKVVLTLLGVLRHRLAKATAVVIGAEDSADEIEDALVPEKERDGHVGRDKQNPDRRGVHRGDGRQMDVDKGD